MVTDKSPSTMVVGLAFFSMFFGSGNLIFPLGLGAQYESHFLISAAGFIITAVLLPTLGILVMLPALGRYERLFDDLLPSRYSRWFFLAVLIFWIPLGSGPRCVVLAHASINTYWQFTPPIWLFSLIFLAVVYACVMSRNKLIDILGKFLTPALLVSIFCIVITSFYSGNIYLSSMEPAKVFIKSLVDGYYTQDLIAAIFFSSALLSMLNLSETDRKSALKKTWRGGLIAVAMLAVLYTALMAASAIHAQHLKDLSGERLVSHLAQIALGNTFGAISSVAVSLACLTTEIALVLVFADFLKHHIFHEKKEKRSTLITLAIIWAMSQLDFSGIMSIIAPAMKVIYPILFVLVLRLLWRTRNQLAD
jgi:LIVCS family branched-chain amino acid:cation transporter